VSNVYSSYSRPYFIRKYGGVVRGAVVSVSDKNSSVVVLSPIKGYRCFIEQETTHIAQYWLVPGKDLSMISDLKFKSIEGLMAD